jgi:peroxiredoxin
MKTSIWLLYLLPVLVACRQTSDQTETVTSDQTETVRFLPIQLIEGYGPFQPGFSPINNSDKDSPLWAKTYKPVKGIPPYWSQTQVSRILLNTRQFVYQNVLAGNISQLDYQSLQKEWNWLPDTTKLSKIPIKCYLYVMRGFNEHTGKWTVMVDTNNNLDFGDETAIYPEKIGNNQQPLHRQLITIQYEVYQKGQIHQMKLPMVLKMAGSELIYNFPQHASVTLKKGNKEYKLLVSSDFTTPDFETTNLVDPSKALFSKKVAPKDEIAINDVFEVDHISYKNKGVDVFNNWLELEPVNSSGKSYSLQVGYPFRPFRARAYNSGQLIDLSQYRGKYVYVDFWAPWCKGCVAEMPALNRVYQKADKNRVVFIGVVKDSPERLAKFLTTHPLAWPQIISDSTNNLVETYHIVGLPISVLLDPTGLVIGRNLRPNELEVALRKANKYYLVNTD